MTYALRNSAFSLVELSIVLVILGLLVGGVLSGQSLIRASELRSISTEYARHTTAVRAFRDKYFALPGDITNATSFWGVDPTCLSGFDPQPLTCNGNGDGRIAYSTTYEEYRAWQQLANAGLIEGVYDGVSDGYDCSWSERSCPDSKLGKGQWWLGYFDTTGYSAARSFTTSSAYGNSFAIFDRSDNTNLMTPAEVWNIDTKIDDGKPASGKLLSFGTLASCTDTAATTNLAANYLLTSTSRVCSLYFLPQF